MPFTITEMEAECNKFGKLARLAKNTIGLVQQFETLEKSMWDCNYDDNPKNNPSLKREAIRHMVAENIETMFSIVDEAEDERASYIEGKIMNVLYSARYEHGDICPRLTVNSAEDLHKEASRIERGYQNAIRELKKRVSNSEPKKPKKTVVVKIHITQTSLDGF